MDGSTDTEQNAQSSSQRQGFYWCNVGKAVESTEGGEPLITLRAGGKDQRIAHNPVLPDPTAPSCLGGGKQEGTLKDTSIRSHSLKYKTDSWFEVNPE